MRSALHPIFRLVLSSQNVAYGDLTPHAGAAAVTGTVAAGTAIGVGAGTLINHGLEGVDRALGIDIQGAIGSVAIFQLRAMTLYDPVSGNSVFHMND